MADLLIRKINPKLKDKLKKRAREHGRSLSDEAQSVLDSVLNDKSPQKKMGTWMRRLLPPEYRGDDLVFEYKGDFPKPPKFD